MEEKYSKKWGGKGKTTVNRESRTVNRGRTDGSGFMVQGEGLRYKPKRGPLSKLITEEEKQNAGIHELSYDFACRTTRLYQWLTEDAEYKEFVQSKQIYMKRMNKWGRSVKNDTKR